LPSLEKELKLSTRHFETWNLVVQGDQGGGLVLRCITRE